MRLHNILLASLAAIAVHAVPAVAAPVSTAAGSDAIQSSSIIKVQHHGRRRAGCRFDHGRLICGPRRHHGDRHRRRGHGGGNHGGGNHGGGRH